MLLSSQVLGTFSTGYIRKGVTLGIRYLRLSAGGQPQAAFPQAGVAAGCADMKGLGASPSSFFLQRTSASTGLSAVLLCRVF